MPNPAPRYIGAALALVLLGGVGAAVTTHPRSAVAVEPELSATATSAVAPQPVIVKELRSAAPLTRLTRTKPRGATSHKAAAKAVQVRRWIPNGTGMWLHEFDKTQGGSGQAIVDRAATSGLTHLFVQTGSSRLGDIGAQALGQVLPASAASGIKVIAWDFADLKDPELDARRLANAARFRCSGCPRVAAVAPDIETAAEGTRISAAGVTRYLTTLRRLLPADIAILATIPWPSELRVGTYPYQAVARHADALLPMTYWYNRSPALVTRTSMTFLRRFHKPIMPVGQGYDSRIDAPYLPADPHPFQSVQAFLVTAKQGGATAVSLWSWQNTGSQQWTALIQARQLYAR